MDSGEQVDHQVVVVGAGIAGLATALALHRKGFKSIVFEKSEALREKGTAITIRPNGWRALDQLGVADTLRLTAVDIQWNGESRCLKRIVLIKTLFDALPPGTVHFGRHIVSIALDPQTTYPVLHLADGTSVSTKILIGCDGGKSAVGEFLELKPTKALSTFSARGVTNYPNGHSFGLDFFRLWFDGGLLGRIPIDDKLVYWFITLRNVPADESFWGDPEWIRQAVIDSLNGVPQDILEMIKFSEQDSLSLTHIRYRAPWDLLLGRFRKGTVAVAGDAMHIMGPFLGQGGSAALEDSIVLTRHLGKTLSSLNSAECGRKIMVQKIGEALDGYVKERRMRMLRLSTQTYITGLLFLSRSKLAKLVYILLLLILFPNQHGHTNFDCGIL